MPPRLELRHLLMIEAIALTDSFSAAADALNITQSALSHRLKEAERRLGVTLAYKQNGRTYLTQSGNVLLNTAQNCIREIERTERELSNFSDRNRQIVRIGASSLYGFRKYPEFLRALSEDSAEIDVHFVSDASSNPTSALKSKAIDIAIMPASIDSLILDSTPLCEDEMVAAMSRDHKKAKKDYLVAEDFVSETYIGYSPGREHGREYERFFEPAAVTPGRVLCAGASENMLAIAQSGLGIAIFARSTLHGHTDQSEICIRRLNKDGIFFEWQAVTRRQDSRNPSLLRVIQSLKSHLA